MNQLIKNNFQRRDPCHFGADPDTRIRNCPEAGTYLQADPDPQHWLFSLVQISVADPDPGLGTILTPGSGIRDKHPGSTTLLQLYCRHINFAYLANQCCGSGSNYFVTLFDFLSMKNDVTVASNGWSWIPILSTLP
jgi:hypothetical protein